MYCIYLSITGIPAFLILFITAYQEGQTALWTAYCLGHDECIEVLTNVGATVDIQDKVPCS